MIGPVTPWSRELPGYVDVLNRGWSPDDMRLERALLTSTLRRSTLMLENFSPNATIGRQRAR